MAWRSPTQTTIMPNGLRLVSLTATLGLVASGEATITASLTGHRLGCETIAPGEYERLMSLAAGAVVDGEQN